MDNLNEIKPTREQQTKLPLFFAKIYWNKVTFIDHEMKLYQYSDIAQSENMRSYFPKKTISKITDFSIDKPSNETE